MSRGRSALLWGVAGALTFLVLLQGYRLFVGALELGIVPTAGIAVSIGGFVTALSFVLEPRLLAKGRS